jgi:hypothetical protein
METATKEEKTMTEIEQNAGHRVPTQECNKEKSQNEA